MKKQISMFLLLGLFISCQVNEAQKLRYDTNKFVLLAALLDDYHQKEGLYPQALQEVEENYRDFLESHPNVKKKYFLESWTYKETKVPFLGTAFGVNIHYLPSPDRKEYYLWARLSEEDTPWDITRLQNTRDSKTHTFHFLAFICNGRPKYLDCTEVDKITLDNMESLFRETKRPIIPELTF